MECETHIDQAKNIRYHLLRGSINMQELIGILGEIYRSDETAREMSVLWDLREANTSEVSSDDVRTLMQFVSAQWGKAGKSKAAIVVSRESDYGMSRMYQSLLEDATKSTIQVFRDRKEADDWLCA